MNLSPWLPAFNQLIFPVCVIISNNVYCGIFIKYYIEFKIQQCRKRLYGTLYKPSVKTFYLFIWGFTCTGYITPGSWKGRRIQYIRVLYCKLLTNGKPLPALPLEAVPGTEPRPQRWEARVLPLCYHGPLLLKLHQNHFKIVSILYCLLTSIMLSLFSVTMHCNCSKLGYSIPRLTTRVIFGQTLSLATFRN